MSSLKQAVCEPEDLPVCALMAPRSFQVLHFEIEPKPLCELSPQNFPSQELRVPSPTQPAPKLQIQVSLFNSESSRRNALY